MYYGGKEKIIKRMNIETGLNFYPYVQKHTDSIVSMTSLKNHIVSGSKDKTIKLWNANNFIDNCTDSIHYDKNIAMTLECKYFFTIISYYEFHI